MVCTVPPKVNACRGAEPDGSFGLRLRWGFDAEAAEVQTVLDAMRGLSLADGRAGFCPALTTRRALELTDEENVDYQVIMSSIPYGIDIAWDAEGALLESAFLLGIIARIA